MTRKPEVKVLAGENETTVMLDGRMIGCAWQSLSDHWWLRIQNEDPQRVENRNEAWKQLMKLIQRVARGDA